ncbi:MAG: YbaK/EbsC family protein [Elusimicrobia bacterium]|nr:YbaK/EbsC family protein [Elusimicrobiota bacterium]
MSIEKVKQYFKQFNIENKIKEFDVSSATVDLAAKALNCEPCRIAKSLSFKIADNKAVIVVAAGDVRVDNKKFKSFFQKKLKMLSGNEVKDFTGHEIGGVCPFAVNEGVDVYLDISLKRFDTVFPACGSSNSAIEMTMEELEKYSSNFKQWIDVCSQSQK